MQLSCRDVLIGTACRDLILGAAANPRLQFGVDRSDHRLPEQTNIEQLQLVPAGPLDLNQGLLTFGRE